MEIWRIKSRNTPGLFLIISLFTFVSLLRGTIIWFLLEKPKHNKENWNWVDSFMKAVCLNFLKAWFV